MDEVPSSVPRTDDPAFQQKDLGIYGETERSTYGVELVKATSSQHRRLSAQPEFVYYLPFLPGAVCPNAPDAMAEYVFDRNKWIRVTYWEVDHLLVPVLMNRQIVTNMVFGIPREEAAEFFNFANGIIVQDPKSQAIYRILVDVCRMVEPSVSMAQPAEKILANSLEVYTFSVQTAKHLYRLQLNGSDPKSFQVIRSDQKDMELWKMMMLFSQETGEDLI